MDTKTCPVKWAGNTVYGWGCRTTFHRGHAKRNLPSFSVDLARWDTLVVLTWTNNFRLCWSWAVFGSGGHSVTGHRGAWRQPPDTNAVVLNIGHLHLGWLVNFCKQKKKEAVRPQCLGAGLNKPWSSVLMGTHMSSASVNVLQIFLLTRVKG